MKNKEIISATVGGIFFGIPYLGLSLALTPSLVMGIAAFSASHLILSDTKDKENIKVTNKTLSQKISAAKKQNKEILALIPKVENAETKDNLSSINSTVSKIIEVVEKDNKKATKINNFFDYYLPVLIKIVNRYDEIENKKLTSKESKNFMEKANKMIKDTNNAFKIILDTVYQKDLQDADAEMKVYELMLKADGIVGDNLIMKGSEESEK